MPLRIRLAQLATFLPAFEPSSPEYGSWNTLGHTRDGLVLPTFRFNDAVRAFTRHLHEHGWVRVDRWSTTHRTTRAAALRGDPQAVETATAEELEMLLTVVVSQPAFSADGLMDAIQSGLIARILRRAAALAA